MGAQDQWPREDPPPAVSKGQSSDFSTSLRAPCLLCDRNLFFGPETRPGCVDKGIRTRSSSGGGGGGQAAMEVFEIQ